MRKRKYNGEGTIFKRKDGRWSAQAYVTLTDGTRKRICITYPDRQKVRDKLDEVLAQEKRAIPFAERNWTVGAYLDYWLECVVPQRVRWSTQVGYESAVRLHIKPTLGLKKLETLGVRDVQQAIDNLALRGVSPRRLQVFRQVLSSALTRAMKEELVFRNVARLAETPKYTKKAISVWTETQAQAFLDGAKAHPWYVGYVLMLTYGLRRGEMLGLRWSDIDFENNCFYIRQQNRRLPGGLRAVEVKTEAGKRKLPLIAVIKELLLEYAKERSAVVPCFEQEDSFGLDGLVLVSRGGTPVEPDNFRRTFYGLIRKIGLPRITLHNTRHVAATMLKNLGVPVKDVQLILGHADSRTTLEIYQHGDFRAQQQAIEGVGQALLRDRLSDEKWDCCQKLLSGENNSRFAARNFLDNGGGRSVLASVLKNDLMLAEPKVVRSNRIGHTSFTEVSPHLRLILQHLRTINNTVLIGAVAVKNRCHVDRGRKILKFCRTISEP